MELTGRSLGHYQVEEEISRGGMGVVYRATDTRLNRDVALKVLPQEVTNDDDVRRRFLKEAQAASALEHPHIAVIHGADEVDGIAYIAMELIRGEKLSDLLIRQRLPAARSLELAGTDAAQAVCSLCFVSVSCCRSSVSLQAVASRCKSVRCEDEPCGRRKAQYRRVLRGTAQRRDAP